MVISRCEKGTISDRDVIVYCLVGVIEVNARGRRWYSVNGEFVFGKREYMSVLCVFVLMNNRTELTSSKTG